MSAGTPAPAPSGPSASVIEADINTAATVAGGVAEAIPGGQLVALGIGAAAAIADLAVRMRAMYTQKIVTEADLIAMVKASVSGYDASVKAWEAAP